MAGRVFISYRRSETAWAARAVFERLWREFPQRVFIDLETIALGADFTRELDHHLEHCEAMLALLGPRWIEELNDRVKHDEPDYAWLEVARALTKGIPVVPVLLDGTPMPKRRDLPADLQALTVRNGPPIVHDTFEAQMSRVVQEVRRILVPAAAVGAVDQAHTTPVQPVPTSPAFPREPWMSDGVVDQYGRRAEFKLRNVVQRMRWIEPGEFWTGSTEAERKRFAAQTPKEQQDMFDMERPRHRVTLTRGYWFADTACTQALWQAVTGDNPSHFTGDPALPVDTVSWDEVCSQFLPELSRLLTAEGWGLPTEAHWEYACRAGTDTAYSWGDMVNVDQVNFDGNHPPPGGVKGAYRKKTVPVKALPRNAWGLHQMHGNLGEWCRDAPRPYTYAAEPARDPDGGSEADTRVLRGGSWFSGAESLRGVRRGRSHPGYREYFIGFRLCRSSPL